MTKAEAARMRRLELENAELRQKIDRHIEIYRGHALGLIELRAERQLLLEIVGSKQPVK